MSFTATMAVPGLGIVLGDRAALVEAVDGRQATVRLDTARKILPFEGGFLSRTGDAKVIDAATDYLFSTDGPMAERLRQGTALGVRAAASAPGWEPSNWALAYLDAKAGTVAYIQRKHAGQVLSAENHFVCTWPGDFPRELQQPLWTATARRMGAHAMEEFAGIVRELARLVCAVRKASSRCTDTVDVGISIQGRGSGLEGVSAAMLAEMRPSEIQGALAPAQSLNPAYVRLQEDGALATAITGENTACN